MGKSGVVNVRKVATEVLQQDHEGDSASALERADALALDHPRSALANGLAGDLHFAAAVRARRDAAAGPGTEEEQRARADAHLRSARDALSAAKLLAPHCVDIAAALGDALAESSMHREAEVEYRRALGMSDPIDPAKHNAAYGITYSAAEPSAASGRILEAKAKAQRAYGRLANKLIDTEVGRVLDIGRRDGARTARPHAKRVAERFPGSARAQLLEAYMDLEFVRGLDAAIDKRACLRRPLGFADRAAQSFPNSAVIAAFRAKLLFVLGEHDAAERECRRALALKIPHDTEDDCIPPGSISAPDIDARLVVLSSQFRVLVLKIWASAEDYWENSMTAERRSDFMSVRLDTLQEEYNMVDQSPAAFTVSSALSFLKQHKSWRFWLCPFCNAARKYLDTDSLLDHMCSNHPRKVSPSLRSIVDPILQLQGDDSFLGVTFCQDSDQHDIMRLEPKSNIFKWLFCGPNRRIPDPKPFAERTEEKCRRGTILLEIINKKLTTLPADKSTAEFARVLFEIQQKWRNFVERTALDYRQDLLILARSFLWRELKKCMDTDPKLTAKRISAADIDAIFANVTEDPGITSAEEQTWKNDHKSGDEEKT